MPRTVCGERKWKWWGKWFPKFFRPQKREGRGGEINYFLFCFFIFSYNVKKPRPNKNMFSASAVRLIRISYYMYTISNCVVLKNFPHFLWTKIQRIIRCRPDIYFLFAFQTFTSCSHVFFRRQSPIEYRKFVDCFLGNYRRENSKVVCWEGLDKKNLSLRHASIQSKYRKRN